MKRTSLDKMSVSQLVGLFTAIGVDQCKAVLENDSSTYNLLFEDMEEVTNELKKRAGDQRSELLRLYDHPNVQVQLAAAKRTLAIAPQQARQLIESIANSHEHPFVGDVGMCLWALDQGIFKPS